MSSETLNLILAITGIAVTSMTFITLILLMRQINLLKKNRKTEDLFTLMEFLHRSEFRDARMEILNLKQDASLNPETAWKICSSFDLAGLMIQHNFVDDNIFLIYWSYVIKLLDVKLNTFIYKTKFNDVPGEIYWKHFIWLIKEVHRIT